MPKIFGYQITSADILKGPLTLLDNQLSPISLASWPLISVNYVQLQYSLTRDNLTTTGHILITTNGSTTSISNDEVELLDNLGVTFSSTIVGSSLNLNYTTTSTGFSATFKYYEKSWL